jgi:hypothetical protein
MEPTSTPDDDNDDLEAPKLGMLIVAAVVALAVGGLAGFAVGFKVEQNRIKSSSKHKRTTAAANAQGNKRRAQPSGEVTQVSPTSITVKTSNGKSRVINLSGTTVVDKVSGGTVADIPQGAKVLFQGEYASDGRFNTTEIIVLPAGSKFAPPDE